MPGPATPEYRRLCRDATRHQAQHVARATAGRGGLAVRDGNEWVIRDRHNDVVATLTVEEMNEARRGLPREVIEWCVREATARQMDTAKVHARAGDYVRARALMSAARWVITYKRGPLRVPVTVRHAREHTPHGRTARTHRATTAGRDDGEDDPDQDPAPGQCLVTWAVPEALPPGAADVYRETSRQIIEQTGAVPWCVAVTMPVSGFDLGVAAVVTEEANADAALNAGRYVALRLGYRDLVVDPDGLVGGWES